MSSTVKPHLWQGIWLDDSQLQQKLTNLADTIDDAQRQPFAVELVLGACDRLSQSLADPAGLVYQSLAKCLREGFGMTAEAIAHDLAQMSEFLSRTDLEKKVVRELGITEPFNFSRPDYRADIFERWAPLGFLVHIAPTNAFSVGAWTVIEGLLTSNVNFLKTGGSDELFAQVFLKHLIDHDPTGTIAPRIMACRISSRDQDLLKQILSYADGVAAWGDETAIEGVRSLAPPLARFIDWGPKISFAYLDNNFLDYGQGLETVLELARECCRLEQQACSSPQCVYVETEDRQTLVQFAERLAGALKVVSSTVARREPDLNEQAEITLVVELCKQEACLDLTHVIEAPDLTWRVLVDYASSLRASPLFRTIWVKPISREKIVQTFRPIRSYLQTVGLKCKLANVAPISDALIQAGVLRITRIGKMLDSYSGEPHDGVYALQRYSKRISAQLGSDLAGICSFAELEAPTAVPPTGPILTKEGFQSLSVDKEFSHLFFKSGGSSGAPKLSVFSHDDYHLQMSAAADGLFAAGLDPARDRCMNLFFGGGLYGGFISFFTILENLKAVQYPMGAHPDLAMVAQTVVGQRTNVLLGMPSYLIQLFGQNAELFRNNQVVDKLFYGGEHFNETQKRYFQQEFGIKLIRSATYGSVDAGPIGFQCGFCQGGVHHLHSRLHILEILDLEKDIPVPPGDLGRVVLTSLARAGQRLERYEIGDLARFVPGVCACGRQTPRFELMGRHGDVFRIGSMFFNHAKFVHILEDNLQYAGELQIVLRSGNKTDKEQLHVLVSSEQLPDSDRTRSVILADYTDLRECVEEDGLLEVIVQSVSADRFQRTPGSGKLRHIVDERELSRKP